MIPDNDHNKHVGISNLMRTGETLRPLDAVHELQPITDRKVVLLDAFREKTEQGFEYAVKYVHVEDPHDPDRAFELRTLGNVYNQVLKDNPSMQPPTIGRQAYTNEVFDPRKDLENFDETSNPAWVWFYGPEGSSMRIWRELIPSGRALYPIQRTDDMQEEFPEGHQVDEAAEDIFLNMLDSIAIRTRGEVMKHIIHRYASQSHVKDIRVVSLGCGAAVAESDASVKIRRELHKDVYMTFYDTDKSMLNAAWKYAKRVGSDLNFLTMEHASYMRAFSLEKDSQDVVDMLGLWEYLNRDQCVKLLRNSLHLLKPGGVFIASNMLDTRDQFELNQRGIGWWPIHSRSKEELASIAREAGADPNSVTLTIPEDGVYAVMEIHKSV